MMVMTMLSKWIAGLAAALLVAIVPVGAAMAADEAANDGGMVAVIVTVKTPPGVSSAMLDAGFRQAVPQYQQIPGLVRKYFTRDDTSFGGMYLWRNRAAAEAWYNPQWRQTVRARYGVDPEVRYFAAPVVIEGAQP